MSESSFISNILQPGSSFHPSFLFAVDCILGSLLIVLVSLAYLTSGNLHIFALIAIELALWASIKWFVNELKNTSNTSYTTEGVDDDSRKRL